MNKPTIQELVRAALILSARSNPVAGVDESTTLHELGYGPSQTIELGTRLYCAISGQNRLSFEEFQRTLNLTPEATVAAVVAPLSEILSLPATGAGLTRRYPEKKEIVWTVLAEKSPALNFLEIEDDLSLGSDLELGPAEIEQIKVDLFKGLGSPKSLRNAAAYDKLVSALAKVDPQMSVMELIGSLPGDDDTQYEF